MRARGAALAALGTEVDLVRGRFLWVFHEPDFRLRKRIIQAYTRADQISSEDRKMIFWTMLAASTLGAFLGQGLWRVFSK